MDLDRFPRQPLLFGPSPLQPLRRLSAHLGGAVELWAKREDCNSGLAFGGNKVRKLEYLAADALAQGADTLVSIGGVQSNHTRAVAAVAAHLGGEVELWAKREDCNSGLAFGGNKVRKLEYLIPEALAQGCDTLVSLSLIHI